MYDLLLSIAARFWPELKSANLRRQIVGVGDVLTSLYLALLSLVGLVWLFNASDFNALMENWPLALLLLALIWLFGRLNFFMIVELRSDRYGSSTGGFDSMMVWTACFLLGPTALWLMIVQRVIQFLINWRRAPNLATRWNLLRDMTMSLAGDTIPYLTGLWAYQQLGGSLPIQDLSGPNILAAATAIVVGFLLSLLQTSPYLGYGVWTQRTLEHSADVVPVVHFFVLAMGMPALAHPFAILASGLYVQNGSEVFLFLIAGLLVVALVARRFSYTAESSRQQTRQIEKLEQLGRAIMNAPPDGSNLTEILEEHIPAMFPSRNVAIWLNPGEVLYQTPPDWAFEIEAIELWAKTLEGAHSFLPGDPLPWSASNTNFRPIIVSPISSHEGAEVIGGIYLELRTLAQPWDQRSLERLYPAVHTLSDQIASALNRAEQYAHSLALQEVSQELRIAGQIQASFLPSEFPALPGWQLAVSLEPASGLSGDFFDLVPLPNDRLGILIADVAGKGLGAALYMALGRTLLRTYAFEYHTRPDLVFGEANDRILDDARAHLFITAFYGILDPENGTFTYANAGHNPPLLIRANQDGQIETLSRTGIPVGIENDSEWQRDTVELQPGDILLFYTDGVTEAQNGEGEFFTEDRLLQVAGANVGGSAYEMQAAVLERLRSFVGDSPQFDDITLMVLSRDQ